MSTYRAHLPLSIGWAYESFRCSLGYMSNAQYPWTFSTSWAEIKMYQCQWVRLVSGLVPIYIFHRENYLGTPLDDLLNNY